MSEAKISRKAAVPVTEWFGDRELLKLAAKAVGIDLLAEEWEDGFIYYYHKIPGDTQGWNPLNCDSDAFRLAVKLDMNIYVGFKKIYVEIISDGDEPPITVAFDKSDDPYAATRRAIVRAAAQIGGTL